MKSRSVLLNTLSEDLNKLLVKINFKAVKIYLLGNIVINKMHFMISRLVSVEIYLMYYLYINKLMKVAKTLENKHQYMSYRKLSY